MRLKCYFKRQINIQVLLFLLFFFIFFYGGNRLKLKKSLGKIKFDKHISKTWHMLDSPPLSNCQLAIGNWYEKTKQKQIGEYKPKTQMTLGTTQESSLNKKMNLSLPLRSSPATADPTPLTYKNEHRPLLSLNSHFTTTKIFSSLLSLPAAAYY